MHTLTTSTLIKRINRRLRQDGESLHVTRGGRSWSDLGNYYVRNFERNFIVAQHVDPEELGRELGVLRADEKVKD